LKNAELVRSLQRDPPNEIILAVVERRKGVGFEQGGVGTSVYRAFLLLVEPLPYWRQRRGTMARNKKPPQDIDQKLDEALDETFPASDPVAVGRNDHPGKPKEETSAEDKSDE